MSYELAHDNPGIVPRNEPAASSSRHRNIDQSAAGFYVPSASRTHKVSSASQQAAQQASAIVMSAPNHSSRRERDKGSKHHSSREARQQVCFMLNNGIRTQNYRMETLYATRLPRMQRRLLLRYCFKDRISVHPHLPSTTPPIYRFALHLQRQLNDLPLCWTND